MNRPATSLDLPLGVCTSVFGHRDALTPDKIRRLAGAGIRWIEVAALQTQHLNCFDDERVDELARAIPAAGLQVWSVHAPFCGLAMDDPDTREDGLRHILQAARVAERFAAGVLVVHPGRDVPIVDRRRELEWMRAGMERASERAPATVRLAVETMGLKSLAGPAEDMLAVVDRLDPDRVGICFDTGHVHTGGDPVAYARAVAGRIVTVHLHDNAGDRDAHALPGEGTIDWPACLRALHEAGYDGVWMSEAGDERFSAEKVISEYARRMAVAMKGGSAQRAAADIPSA